MPDERICLTGLKTEIEVPDYFLLFIGKTYIAKFNLLYLFPRIYAVITLRYRLLIF